MTTPANDDSNPFQILRKEDGIYLRETDGTADSLKKLCDPGKDEKLKEAVVEWLESEDFGEK